MKSIFSISNLTKVYGDKRVLDIEGLELEEGRITGIIGPSGAGKSTLLYILNGLEKASEGRIVFDGKEMKNEPDLDTRRQMTMVFQRPTVFNTSVHDNMAYGLKLRGIKNSEAMARVAELARLIGLEDKLQQRAATLSGGEAQRLSLARAIIHRPKVLLLDEPTANLDPANVAMIEKLVLYTKEEYGTSVVMITHNMFQAKRISEKLVFLLNGSIVECGDTNEVFGSPRDDRTLDFIEGRMIY
ncbi:MAG TPA: ATP-binding cassette domain-containing protein [Negativicutes bacterium]|nr:ATP-binding cassette domain-containing protein [Negativicutes bacterium]